MNNPTKLNIGIFTHDFYPIIGGQGKQIHELYLQNQRFEQIDLRVYAPGSGDILRRNAFLYRLVHGIPNNILFSAIVSTIINPTIRQDRLDIVHLHSGPGGLLLFRRPNAPTVITAHHTYWQQYHYITSQRWKAVLYWLEKRSYAFADRIICVSQDTKSILVNHYQVNEKIITVIPNGVTTDAPGIHHSDRKSGKHLLFVGRIDRRKGVDFLIEAFRIIAKQDPDIILHVAGDGKDRRMLERNCREDGLRVVFHGRVSDAELEKLYEDTCIQVVPSIFEGFGIVVLEAMARRIPVIATNVDGIRCIIDNGVNGILVNYGDRQAMAERILSLLSNPEKAYQLAQHAASDLDKFRWDHIYQDTVRVYRELAKMASGPGAPKLENTL